MAYNKEGIFIWSRNLEAFPARLEEETGGRSRSLCDLPRRAKVVVIQHGRHRAYCWSLQHAGRVAPRKSGS